MKNLEQTIEYSWNLKLLYVEDNQSARATALDIFEDFFENITVAVNGADGLEKLNKNEIDIIITDINMPKLTGIEMIKKIREFDKDISILILSAHNETSFFMESIKLGVAGYLLKPIDIDQFTDSLHKCVENIVLKKENFDYKHYLERKVQKQLEDLREKDKILLQKSKMASMGEMIDAIAHQWKQPLNIIQLQTNSLHTKALMRKNLSDKIIVKYCEKTYKQITHLTTTLNEFRNFFRPNNGKENINIKKLLTSITILLADELKRFSIEIEISCPKIVYLLINQNDLTHLIINLINNAKEEMIKNQIEKKKICLLCYKKDDKTIIKVKDNGKGIPKEIINKIFDSNFTTKKSSGGTGVGLYMCKTIATKYQAELKAQNNDGAEFLIIFN